MKIKQHVSDKEFVDYIFSQDREREIDMSQANFKEGECGCIMVHFGLDHGIEEPEAGFTVVHGKNKKIYLESPIYRFAKDNIKNYGQAQDYLLNQEWAKELISK